MVGYDLPGLICVRRVNDGFAQDEVFLALRIVDGAEVAVRVFHNKLVSDRDRLRFCDEVAVIQTLSRQPYVNLPQQAGVNDDGLAYTVVEYCVAGSLHDHLIDVGRFTPAEVRRIGAKLAGALQAAHQQSIYHRSIKPANILINGAGEPVLTDFALVTIETADGNYTPPEAPTQRAFAAPEAFLPELMAAAADIYSLGATLYALLAGWAPRSSDPLAVAVDGDSVVDLPRVPWALMTIVRRAMALDPRERYVDAEEFRAALAAG